MNKGEKPKYNKSQVTSTHFSQNIFNTWHIKGEANKEEISDSGRQREAGTVSLQEIQGGDTQKT